MSVVNERAARVRGALLAVFASTAFVAATMAVEACGDDARPGASNGSVVPGVEAGTSDAGGGSELEAGIVKGDPDAGVVTCPGPALGGAVVNVRNLGGVPPADTGGTITAGTYDLSDVQVYAGLDEPGDTDAGPDAGAGAGATARATLVLGADSFSLATTSTSAATGTLSTVSIGKQHTDDVFLVVDETCPTTDSRQTPFTATPTTLTLHTAQTRLEVFTRRP